MSKITYADKQFLYENAQIPANQKVQDEDLNNIKGAINQNGAYTPTTFSNNQYSCTLTGTLSAGDIIQVQLDLSNQNLGTDSDISISVNGGSNYYNILDKTGEFNLKASDFDFNNIYLKALFNGSNFVLISPDRVRNILVLGLSSNQSMSTSNTSYNINYDTILYQRGNRLFLAEVTPVSSSFNGIKIGNGINTVSISQIIQFDNNNNSSDMYFVGYTNLYANQESTKIMRAISGTISPTYSVSTTMSEYITNVTTGDYIYGSGYKSLSNGNADIGSGARTYITVKEI